jgi:hypothetical protein
VAKVDQIFCLVRIIKELERHKESGGLTYEELKELKAGYQQYEQIAH